MNNLSPHDLDSLLDRQKEAWLAGSRPRIEDLLAESSLPVDVDVVLDLLYNEVVLREELGDCPSLDDYLDHYPQLAEELRLHFEIHAALEANLLNNTHDLGDLDSVPERDSGALEIGPEMEDYDILAPLGQGGMGIVYKARHRRLQRLVALKMFKPGRVPSPRELARFQTEAEAIARLQHPNIVQIFEVGQTQGLPFLALELAEGGTLAHKLQHLPFVPKAAAELIGTLARAVQHAHEQQIIHRDLKPANVLFCSNGATKITDFGLAKMLEDSSASPSDATRTGEPMGTPRYMAPEQAAGRPDLIGPGTDIYALGTLLYECLTGQVPFVTASAVTTMEKIRAEEPLAPRRLQPTIPRDLETICLKCLHKQPARRYTSAQSLSEDLGRFLQGEPIRARPTPAWEHVWRWCRRHPAQAVLAAVALLAVAASLMAYGVHQRLEQQRLDKVRNDVAGLVRDGKEALERHDNKIARERFLTALTLVRAEPALHDDLLGILGWLDHSFRQDDQERWQQRRPPPLFDELRDEALVQCILLEPQQQPAVAAARQAIQDALKLTVADDPAWTTEREQLALLDAGLILHQGDAAAALALLERSKGIESRLWYQRRAECLDRLDRKPEADQARRRANQMAPQDTLAFFVSGIERLHRQDLAGAIGDFDSVLLREPDHFMARLFQAACFLRLQRLGEAKVAFTACLGQRRRFAWTYLLRGQVYVQLNEPTVALQDFQRGLDMNPRSPARCVLLAHRGWLYLQLRHWSRAYADFKQALALRMEQPCVAASR